MCLKCGQSCCPLHEQHQLFLTQSGQLLHPRKNWIATTFIFTNVCSLCVGDYPVPTLYIADTFDCGIHPFLEFR